MYLLFTTEELDAVRAIWNSMRFCADTGSGADQDALFDVRAEQLNEMGENQGYLIRAIDMTEHYNRLIRRRCLRMWMR